MANRVSGSVDAYTHETVIVAALQRATMKDAALSCGQTIEFVVLDDGASGPRRVRLDFEVMDAYDPDWYEVTATRAVESMLLPLEWHRDAIKRYLATTEEPPLTSY